MLRLSELTGLWQRSLIRWPDGRCDSTTKVQWLQGVGAFGDLRQPVPWADFSHVRSLTDMSRLDCERLAQQQAFAGYLTVVGDYFEWTRLIDYQPAGRLPDAGSLRWQQDILVEEGRDVPYVEHWHRESATDARAPIAGAILRHATHDTTAILLKVGELAMFARDRATALPPGNNLRECIDAAGTLDQARAIVDCEISFATATPDGFLINASTLPFRVGQPLPELSNTSWNVKKSEGDLAALGLWQNIDLRTR
jgi:hypothetical protein